MIMLEELIGRLDELGIKRVAIFDDYAKHLDDPWFAKDSNWAAIFAGFEDRVVEGLGQLKTEELRTLPDENRASEIEALLPYLPKEAVEGFQLESGEILSKWTHQMKSFGLEVDLFSNWNDYTEEGSKDIVSLQNYHLVLLDYDFGDELGNARHSELIATNISELLTHALTDISREQKFTPPLLVMFSARNIQQKEEEKADFVERVGFARGCYDFVPKNIIFNAQEFIDYFAGFIYNAELGRKLYTLSLDISKSIIKDTAKSVSKMFYRLDPQSIKLLSKNRLFGEGVTSLDYFLEVFVGLLATSLSKSEKISESTKNFLDELGNVQEINLVLDHRGFCLIQNELHFDYKINHFQKSISIGDIFLFNNQDEIGILITQSCDMSIRGKVSSDNTIEFQDPAVERVLLLPGKIIDLPDDRGDYTRYFARSESETELPNIAIEWDFKNPVILPRYILDLVTLDKDGRGVIPLKTTELSVPWWTNAYTNYMKTLLNALQEGIKGNLASPTSPSLPVPTVNEAEEQDSLMKSIKQTVRQSVLYIKEPEQQHRIVFFDNPTQRAAFSLGASAVYNVSTDDNQLVLPIKRVARLRLPEVLRIQQKFHAQSGRIGVITDLRPVITNHDLYISNKVGTLVGPIPGRCIKIDGKCTEFRVNVIDITKLCQGIDIYDDLVSAISGFNEFVDLHVLMQKEEGRFYGYYQLSVNTSKNQPVGWSVRHINKKT